MMYQGGTRASIVAASTADEFEAKLNKMFESLDRQRIKYEVKFPEGLGFCAYIVKEHKMILPETIADEFELAGERHTCVDCPYWQHPTDGRVKYTRCEVTPGIHGAKSPCCDAFYEMLYNGEITLAEVTDAE